MKNSKGFTLIELLAVIIILAIIAVITTPIILNVVNKARLDAAKDKAWGTIDAVRLAYAQYQSEDTEYAGGTIEVKFYKDANTGKYTGSINNTTPVRMSGQIPQGGTVTINEDGTITCQGLIFDAYSCTTTDGNTMNCKTK